MIPLPIQLSAGPLFPNTPGFAVRRSGPGVGPSGHLPPPAGIVAVVTGLSVAVSWAAVTGADHYEYKLDGGAWTTNADTTVTIDPVAEAGPHRVYVRAVDGSAVLGLTGSAGFVVVIEVVATLDDLLSLDPATPVGTGVFVTAEDKVFELRAPSATVAGFSITASEVSEANSLYLQNGTSNGRAFYSGLGDENNSIRWVSDLQSEFGGGTPSAPGWASETLDGLAFYSTDDVATPVTVSDWLKASDDTNSNLLIATFTQGQRDAGVTVVGGQGEDDIYPAAAPFNGFNSYVQLGGEQALIITFSGTLWTSFASAATDGTAFPWDANWAENIPAIAVTRNDVASLANWLEI